MVQDTSQIKEKIVLSIKRRGPSIPVHISREVDQSILFTSAFLSELLSENRLKISNMRVGSSPIYYIPGQENLLENYLEHVKGKEKEALLLLKKEEFLKDTEMEPAIRVALRSIRDFAIPFRSENEIYWRYFTIPESDFKNSATKKAKETPKEEIKEESRGEIKESVKKPREETVEEPKKALVEEKPLEIFDKNEKKPSSIRKAAKKKPVSKTTKKNEKFLEKVKEFLSKDGVEISGIEGLKNDELILKIRVNGEERLLVAFNKKKITEKEIIKAAKKASEYKMKYSILSLGELPKKISELMEALQNLKEIGKVE